ncbi:MULTISPECIES: hypothetical protein [unclassified Blastococcus]|uniref:hypothetical protein n=1 Tax=unclassified Blastococcus TaxID=2619396 RepID=UPI001EF0B94A|nr:MULTISPECIES: hypothetical protein [unclassified Blastococcus]MCF6514116.1 hypothetical protein [Blastococcus sp. MG754427]
MNEAETRFHLIDSLLVDVLRWTRDSIHVESFTGEGFIDYALGDPGPQLVLEAKKEGVHFSLPVGTTVGIHKIANLAAGQEGKPLKAAMEQVAGYAARTGVGPAAVCNGRQLVLFLAVRTDGTPPMEGQALVFPSLEDMRSSFRLLWDNASPLGLQDRTLFKTLRSASPAIPDALAAHLPNYPGTKRRNDLQAGLEILGELFLEDVSRLEELREDFLRECYSTSGALSQYAQVSKQILQTRYALLGSDSGIDAMPVERKKGLSPELTQDMLAAATSRRPIILLGDVGSGKSTFIQRLVHVEAPELFDQAISLYIDFGSSSTLGALDAHVVDNSIDQLNDRYGIDIEQASFVEAVYRRELKRFESGVVGALKDTDPTGYLRERVGLLQRLVEARPTHLRKSLEHITATWHRQVVVFLDNIDQRSADDQNQVFLIANELASTWPATVFVTLRPETFYQSSRDGAVSGYHPRVFTISPPRADVMLQRRVKFALNQLEETGRLGSYPVGVTVDSDSLRTFLDILSDNFRNNRPLLALIENLAGGNMRLALGFVTDFIGSGHIDTRKMIEIQKAYGRYTVAVHEFLRSLMFGDGNYYDPASSAIPNLLRIHSADGREHFLLPLLLAQVQSLGEKVARDGYVAADAIHRFAHDLGFEESQIAAALDRAARSRLVQATPRTSGPRTTLQYRITTVGAYSLRTLLGYFTYYDAIVVDTPILDAEVRRTIVDAFTLPERLERVSRFQAYLDRQWRGFGDEDLPWAWPETSRALAEDVENVRARGVPASGGRPRGHGASS